MAESLTVYGLSFVFSKKLSIYTIKIRNKLLARRRLSTVMGAV
jgi:hypothetical protein